MEAEIRDDMHGDKVPVFSFMELVTRFLALFWSSASEEKPKGKATQDLHRENREWCNPPAQDPEPEEDVVRLHPKLWDNAFTERDVVLGYDVSSHQGPVDHEKFDDYPFVIIKATEGGKSKDGEGFVDPRFEENKRKLLAAGKIWSAYHFARVSHKSFAGEEGIEADARNEAEWFLDHYGRKIEPGMLPPVLDIEWDKRATAAGVTSKKVVRFCEVFVEYIKDELGVWPIVYTGPNFWRFRLRKTLSLSQCPLWIVSGYTNKHEEPAKEIPGWDWVIHQHTNKEPRPDGKPPGTSGRMDANFFRGSMADLRAMAYIPENAKKQELALS